MALISIPKNYQDGDPYFESDVDDIRDGITDFLNTTKINDDNIQDSGITGSSKLVAGSVSAGNLGTDSVTTVKINALAVTTAKIDALAVTTAKIDALAVTTAKIAVDAVTGDKIVAGAISLKEISNTTSTTITRGSSAGQLPTGITQIRVVIYGGGGGGGAGGKAGIVGQDGSTGVNSTVTGVATGLLITAKGGLTGGGGIGSTTTTLQYLEKFARSRNVSNLGDTPPFTGGGYIGAEAALGGMGGAPGAVLTGTHGGGAGENFGGEGGLALANIGGGGGGGSSLLGLGGDGATGSSGAPINASDATGNAAGGGGSGGTGATASGGGGGQAGFRNDGVFTITSTENLTLVVGTGGSGAVKADHGSGGDGSDGIIQVHYVD